MAEDTPSPFNRYQAEWLARELGMIKTQLAALEARLPDPAAQAKTQAELKAAMTDMPDAA